MDSPFRRILVTTDFSELGNKAVPVAFLLAQSQAASVLLTHVLEGTEIPTPLYSHYHPTPGPEQLKKMEERARAALSALVPSACASVPHEIHVGRGRPAQELCRMAEEQSASLVVISSHGHSGLKHFLLGSVAERIAQRAPCSVLVLR